MREKTPKEVEAVAENINQRLARNCIDGLTLYAIERTLAFETHQKFARNPKKRNTQIREMIKNLAEFYKLSENIKADFLEPFDERLREAKRSFGAEIASLEQQKAVVNGLALYAERLAEEPTDKRPELLRVQYLLDDISCYLPWDSEKLSINPERDHLDRMLASLTALRNILFTRVLLGPERGPAMSDFVAGAVEDEAGVLGTCLYDDMHGQYPEIKKWPALCTVYRGGYCRGKPEIATEMDLQIMRATGDKFLDLEGIEWCSGTYEFTVHAKRIEAGPQQTM